MKDQSSVTAFFSKNPASYADEYARETADGYSFRVRKERVIEMLGHGKGKLLDIGCGPGVMSREIASLGYTYIGCDISSAMIEEAKIRVPELEFSVQDATAVNAPDNSLAAIVAMGLVEYIDDAKTLMEFKRLLVPGGRVFISIPNWFSPARMWDRWILSPISQMIRLITGKQSKATYHREYSVSEYKKVLASHGFTFEKAVAYNFRILPRPLDYWLPRLSVALSKLLEPLRNSPFAFIATAYNIEAKKASN